VSGPRHSILRDECVDPCHAAEGNYEEGTIMRTSPGNPKRALVYRVLRCRECNGVTGLRLVRKTVVKVEDVEGGDSSEATQ